MGRPIFTSWIDHPRARAASSQRGIHFHGDFASWAEVRRLARERSANVRPGMVYVADSRAGLQGIVSMLAIAMKPDTALIWAKVDDVPFPIQPLAPGLYQVADQPGRPIKRPMYGTLTSGSSGTPKVPMAYGDILELIALHYDEVLFQPTFPGHPEVNVLATCLPLEYAASFMMLVVPAMFMCRDLVVFPPQDWSALHEVATREHVACLVVPSLMAAASAVTSEHVDMSRTALIMASGYLSRERVAATREKFRGVSILNCYGASETGVVTLDRDPDGSFHVGRPIFGKAVWLEEIDGNGIGKVTTTGIDCREFYWGQEDSLRRADGSLAATDFGHFDDAGNLYLDGRIDGAEKLQGVTIYPRQIERHLLMLPGVLDVRVRVISLNGVERLEARVVGTVTEGRVREHCSTLPEVSRPTHVECFSEGTTPYSERGKL